MDASIMPEDHQIANTNAEPSWPSPTRPRSSDRDLHRVALAAAQVSDAIALGLVALLVRGDALFDYG